MVAGQADYLYPNDMSSRLLWYHDHALGITRLNAYAGVASGYLIRDAHGGGPGGQRDDPAAFPAHPAGLPGQDLHTRIGKPRPRHWGPRRARRYVVPQRLRRARRQATPVSTLPIPSCVPEFFGDTMLVNGLVYPYVEVEQRKYRFRP